MALKSALKLTLKFLLHLSRLLSLLWLRTCVTCDPILYEGTLAFYRLALAILKCWENLHFITNKRKKELQILIWGFFWVGLLLKAFLGLSAHRMGATLRWVYLSVIFLPLVFFSLFSLSFWPIYSSFLFVSLVINRRFLTQI